MPFSNVTSVAGPDDALTEIRNFISGSLTGWTFHRDLTSPPVGEDSAGGRELAASKGNILFGLRSTTTGASSGNLFLFDGVPPWSSSNLDEMPGNSGIRVSDTQYDDTLATARYWNEVGGTWPNLWMFGADSPQSYVHVVAEVSAGFYYHLAFGELIKQGTWTGGEYYSAQYWNRTAIVIDIPDSSGHTALFDALTTQTTQERNATIRASTTSPTSSWVGASRQTDVVVNSVQRRSGFFGGVRGGWMAGGLWNAGVQELSGFSLLFPITAWFNDAGPSPDAASFLGQVPDVFGVNMESIDPQEVLTFGGDDYRVFPLASKLGAVDTPNSGLYGLAYREV